MLHITHISITGTPPSFLKSYFPPLINPFFSLFSFLFKWKHLTVELSVYANICAPYKKKCQFLRVRVPLFFGGLFVTLNKDSLAWIIAQLNYLFNSLTNHQTCQNSSAKVLTSANPAKNMQNTGHEQRAEKLREFELLEGWKSWVVRSRYRYLPSSDPSPGLTDRAIEQIARFS